VGAGGCDSPRPPDHDRAHTAERLSGLEVVARRVVRYRGGEFEEMDVDAVIGRAPDVALVDELAHTNVPGSGRHAKRWEDVLEILDAGIAVVTTVNIQHLESVADAVERMTGVSVRERVPDWVVRRADQIELVDSSADQLRRRMLHGNIYPPERVPAALGGFFRSENLAALRELALRFVADETEEELLDALAGRHAAGVWETTERIMVAVTGAPGTDAVVRRAARLAARVKGELLAVHVASEDDAATKGSDAAMAAVRRLVDDVGGTWLQCTGDDPARAIVDVAAEHRITQIVLGATRRSRWAEWRGGSVVRAVLREAAEAGIDVHVIARRDVGPEGIARRDVGPEG